VINIILIAEYFSNFYASDSYAGSHI